MTIEEVTELFIHAAMIERRLPNTSGPAKLKAQALPFVYDWEDKLGWGDERHAEERASFFESKGATHAEVTAWERTADLILFVQRDRDRRCLWNWAMSKAGGMSFSKWCRNVEHVHRNYGMVCSKRAVFEISMGLSRSAMQHSGNGRSGTLHKGSEIGDIPVIIAADVHTKNPRSWMTDDARPLACDFDRELQQFDWAEIQNERRRQRDKKRRKAA